MVAPSTAIAVLLGTTIFLSVAAASREPSDDEEPGAWQQWGGPSQDFVAPAEISRESWPEDGPQTLWRRPLGDGFSAILFDSGRLFTMAKAGTGEAVLCLSAKSGATIWEYRYEHDRFRGHAGYGEGPRSTPLLADRLLFTVGVTGKMHALDATTDDYVQKPFEPRELVARVESLLRRPRRRQRAILSSGDLALEIETRQVTMGGRVIELTSAEFDLLRTLMENSGRVLSRDSLLLQQRGLGADVYDRSIDMLVSRLRRKLVDDSRAPRLIKTIRGVGYQFVGASDG